ncbi:MAG: Mini-ribonuclease 3 [Eubacteriales bacterium]
MRTDYDGIVLAYIGDGVLELLVREKLIKKDLANTGKLSAMAQSIVCAPAQSKAVDILLPLLDGDETEIYKLGRNHKITGKPKRASAVEYHRATGMEAVFGYLYLSGKHERIHELFDKIYSDI